MVVIMKQNTYVEDSGIREMFLKSDGRLNRLRFFKRNLAVGLFNMIAMIILAAIFRVDVNDPSFTFLILSAVISVACLVPYYCLCVRRLHDLNKNNILAVVVTITNFISLFFSGDQANVPIILTIASLVSLCVYVYLFFSDGTHGPNFYGPDPLGRSDS